MSLQNYWGLTERTVAKFRHELEEVRTLTIHHDEIYSLYSNLCWYGGLTIKLNNGSGYLISSFNDLYPDAWWPAGILFVNRFRVNKETQYYRLYYNENLANESHLDYKSCGLYEINISDLLDDYKNGRDLIFENKKENTEIIKKQIKWYLHDWSIGLGGKMESR